MTGTGVVEKKIATEEIEVIIDVMIEIDMLKVVMMIGSTDELLAGKFFVQFIF